MTNTEAMEKQREASTRRATELALRETEHKKQMAERQVAARRWAREGEQWRTEFAAIQAGQLTDGRLLEARWIRIEEEAERRAEEMAAWARQDREREARIQAEDERRAREIAAWMKEEGFDGQH